MIVWPPLLTPRNIKFTPDARSRSGGVSLVGTEQVIASSGGVWRATLGAIPVMTQEKRLAWAALEAQIQGRVGEVLVPRFSIDQPNMISGIPHSDDTSFSDGSGYSQPEISAVFAQDAALRATQIVLTVLGGTVQPGHDFSVGIGRLYRIGSLVSTDGDSSTFKIWPPLRGAVLEGSDADFASPKCLMRLVSDDAMSTEFELGRTASPSVDFVEII